MKVIGETGNMVGNQMFVNYIGVNYRPLGEGR